MLKKMMIFTLFGLLPAIVFAEVHKCPGPDGKVLYQEKPCADGGGTPLNINTGKQAPSPKEEPTETRKATQEETTECLKSIKGGVAYKDPESVRIEGDAYRVLYADGHTVVLMEVNAKNSYGAYAGAKAAMCKYKSDGSFDKVLAN